MKAPNPEHVESDANAARAVNSLKRRIAFKAIDIVAGAYEFDWVEKGSVMHAQAYGKLMAFLKEVPALDPDRVPPMERFVTIFRGLVSYLPTGTTVDLSHTLAIVKQPSEPLLIVLCHMVDYVTVNTSTVTPDEAARHIYSTMLDGHPGRILDRHSWVPSALMAKAREQIEALEAELTTHRNEMIRLRNRFRNELTAELVARMDHHDLQETQASAMDMEGSAKFHRAVRAELELVLTNLQKLPQELL